ncbi:GTP-binding DUF697 domain-containing protein [Rubripirellula sp.]|nr:GTPase [Rubripirellula sp.]MDB4621216.1 GTP-binding DUF697 domain-containing protein [Rubripirellula sp.]
MSLFEKFSRVFQSGDVKEQLLSPAFQYHDAHLPTLWLLGKTGAGKSTLVQSITGNTDAEIGKGFRPCTENSMQFGFPVVKPVLQFLDTRGLGESGYDAAEDIELCARQGHALVIVMKVGDTEQSDVLHAIRKIKSSQKISNYLLVHTASHLVSGIHERERLVQYNYEQTQRILGSEISSVVVDFKLPNGAMDGVDNLLNALSEMLPIVSLLLKKKQCNDEEVKQFQALQAQVIWYSGVAGVSDIVPGIGLVAVPGIQWKMLSDLARSYDMNWNKSALAELLGALGAGIGVRYSMKFGTRQVVKFLPAWGQTVGAASAAVMSFCTTYAIGRVACKYMHHKNHNEHVSDEELRALFYSAFARVKTLATQELSSDGRTIDNVSRETDVVAGALEAETRTGSE